MVLDYLNDFWQLACFLFPWLPNQFLQHAPHPPFATFPFQPVCCCRNLNGEVHVVEDDLERTSVNRNCGTNNSAHLVLVTSVIPPISCLEGWGLGSPCPGWLGKLPGTPGIYEHVLNWCYYSDCRAISGPKDLAKGRRSKSSGMILNILLVYFVPRILWREGWLAGRLAGGTSYINRFLACQLPLEPLRGGKRRRTNAIAGRRNQASRIGLTVSCPPLQRQRPTHHHMQNSHDGVAAAEGLS